MAETVNSLVKGVALFDAILVIPQVDRGIRAQNDDGQTFQDALLFHYKSEETLELRSDITDHYVEDNSTVQDHIALSPERIRVSGFIGELNSVIPTALANLEAVPQRLLAIPGADPELTIAAQMEYLKSFQAYQVAASAKKNADRAWESLGGGVEGQSVENKQQRYYRRMYQFWKQRRLFTVQTPWVLMDNMAIENVRALQDESTNQISNFVISFKRFNIATTETRQLSVLEKTTKNGRLEQQVSPSVNGGVYQPRVNVANRFA